MAVCTACRFWSTLWFVPVLAAGVHYAHQSEQSQYILDTQELLDRLVQLALIGITWVLFSDRFYWPLQTLLSIVNSDIHDIDRFLIVIFILLLFVYIVSAPLNDWGQRVLKEYQENKGQIVLTSLLVLQQLLVNLFAVPPRMLAAWLFAVAMGRLSKCAIPTTDEVFSVQTIAMQISKILVFLTASYLVKLAVESRDVMEVTVHIWKPIFKSRTAEEVGKEGDLSHLCFLPLILGVIQVSGISSHLKMWAMLPLKSRDVNWMRQGLPPNTNTALAGGRTMT